VFCNHPGVSHDDDSMHAADEPTAMWDGDSLQELGLDGLHEPKPPATAGTGAGGSVQIDLGPAGSSSQAPSPAKSGMSGPMGWAVTLLAAGVLGTAVFFLVRLLR
jgi:hypothetical protein